jgi:antitoxin component YwqK of YwqJK toxin-antitoxin module
MTQAAKPITLKEKIQNSAAQFFKDRTEKNFSNFYEVTSPVVRSISMKMLKNSDVVDEVVSEVFVKIWTNENYVFDEEKSYYSYLFTTTLNCSRQIYKKIKEDKLITESSLINDPETENMIDYLNNNQKTVTDTELDFTINPEYYDCFHENKKALYIRVYSIVDEIAKGKNAELLKDIFFENTNRNNLADIYGINSRITITSRRRRAAQKINFLLTLEINGSKFASGEKISGDFVLLNKKTGTKKFVGSCVEGRLNGCCKTYSPNGVLIIETNYTLGIRNGKHSEWYLNGKIKVDGTYENGIKVGEWKRYNESGEIDEIYDFDENHFKIFENGKILEEGYSLMKNR